MNRTLLSLFLALACAAAAVQCKKDAARLTGVVDFISGEVSLTTPEKTARARVGDAVLEGMKISTGKKSFAQVRFGENVLQIYELTAVEFSSLSGGANNAPETTEMWMDKGTIFSNVALKLAKGDSHRVSSSTMIAAVRGTEYLYSVDDNNGFIACYRGAMSVLRAGSTEEIILNAGEMLYVKKGKKMKPENIPAGFRYRDFEYGKDPSRKIASDMTDEPVRNIAPAKKDRTDAYAERKGGKKISQIKPVAEKKRAAVKGTTEAAGGDTPGGIAAVSGKKEWASAKEKNSSVMTAEKEQALRGEKKAAPVTYKKRQKQPGALLTKPRVNVPEVK